MGKLRARIIDRNRYGKRYPFVRAPKRYSYMGDSDLSIELGTLTFENSTEETFVFEEQFPSDGYVVIAMPRDSQAAYDASVSLMVDASSQSRSSVKILASAAFTGQVDVMAIKVG